EVAERVHTEIDTVLEGRPPHFDDLPRLEYLDRVVTEVLRLHTPLVFMRRTLSEVRVGGAVVPAGAEVVYSPARRRVPRSRSAPTSSPGRAPLRRRARRRCHRGPRAGRRGHRPGPRPRRGRCR
ncbi:cytochrome P450, partial [Streptomyces daliensis]|nr:cytochrome P450 [Streptomyces daliensis]